MTDLRVSKDLELPRQFVTHRNALLGMSGSGKSNASVVIAEEMFRAGLPWIAIDPKGDWFGIRSSRDGKRPGLDVPIIGGEHGDLPLASTQGKRLGELVAEGKVTGIFDLSGFETDGERARFMADFGRALFRGRRRGDRVICKHKRDEERETTTPRQVVDPAKFAVLQEANAIAEEWVTPTRLEHVLDKLPGASMEQTREVIAAMVEDVLREGAGELVDSREARAAIGKKTAELFRKHLNDSIRKTA